MAKTTATEEPSKVDNKGMIFIKKRNKTKLKIILNSVTVALEAGGFPCSIIPLSVVSTVSMATTSVLEEPRR